MGKTVHDVIIIGSGPAGYTAALYSSRAFVKTLVIAGPEPGGQLTTTTEVDNFPGFTDGIMGPILVENMKKQAQRFGSELISDYISQIKYEIPSDSDNKTKKHGLFYLQGNSQEYVGKSVIIATGASAKRLGLASEETYRGKGISYCATCDGFFFRGKSIAVLGGGDTAMEEATFLTKFASKVTIIHRRDTFRASAIMLEKARKDPKITFLTDKTVEEFSGDNAVKSIRLKDNKTGQTEDFPVDGVFVAIGHDPNTKFLHGFLDLDQKGYVELKKSSPKTASSDNAYTNSLLQAQTETSVPGVFAAGDCVDPRYRQAIVAAGMGCMAAIDAQKWLEEEV